MSESKDRSVSDIFPWAQSPSEGRTFTEDVFGARLPGLSSPPPEEADKPAMWRQGRLPEWAQSARPSLEDVSTAFGVGTAKGVAELTPPGGFIAGARIGLRTPPINPFVNPLTGALGLGAAGYFAGVQAERAAKELLPVTREDVRAYEEAGKTLAQNAMIGGAMLGLAGRARAPVEVAMDNFTKNAPRNSVEWVKSFLSAPTEFVRRSPGAAAIGETAAATGSAVGAGIAESYFPGSPGARLSAELVGGVLPGFTPLGVLAANGDQIQNVLFTSVGRSTAEQKAANYLRELYERAGLDPEDARKMLLQQQPPELLAVVPGGMTAAQLTGLPIMSALERTLSRGNATLGNKFSSEVDRRGKNSISVFYSMLGDLTKNGSPEALQLAATLRRDYAVGLLQGRFDLAQKEVAEAIARFHRSGGAAGERDWGRLLSEQVDSAITDIRAYEKDLWKTANRSIYARDPATGQIAFRKGLAQAVEVDPDNTLRAYFEMRAADPDIEVPGMFRRDVVRAQGLSDDDVARYRQGKRSREVILSGQDVPDQFFKRQDPETGELVNYRPISADQMIDMRSQILADIRKEQAQGNYQRAHFLNKMQQGILDDLSTLNLPEFEAAKAFSRAMNDRFTRTFVDDVAAVDPSGAQRIAPEILASRVFGAGRAGRTLTDLRMQELEDAMKFVSQNAQQRYARAVTELGDNPTPEQLRELGSLEDAVLNSQARVSSVMEGNGRLLQMMASETVDDTGKINAQKLSRFINDYGPALDRYGLTPDLTDAVKAQALVDAAGDPNSYLNKVMRSQAAFARVLDYESPIRAVEAAMKPGKGSFPVRDITNIAKMAKKGGPDAVEGLKSVLFDIAYMRGGGETGTIDIDAYKNTFFGPLDKGAPTLAAIMEREGILSAKDVQGMRNLLTNIERVQASMTNVETVQDLLGKGSKITELAVKVGGARIGSLVSSILPGPGNIQTPGFFSDLARSMFLKEPSVLFKGVIEEAMLNPQFQAELLARPRNAREKFELSRRIHAHLYGAGLRYSTFDEELPEEEPPAVQAPRPAPFRSPSTAPTTRGVPGISPPGQGGQQGPQGAAPQGNARAMLQSLFPFDATLAGMPLQTPPGAPPTGP